MTRTLKRLTFCLTLAALLAPSAGAGAQTQQDPHHPPGAPAGPQSQMPGGGMMGPGMMGGMMGGRGMMGMGMMGDCPMMGGASTHAEGRVAFLRAELGITDSQKAVWDAYAAALRKNLTGMQAMGPTMMKAMQAKTPAERLDAHLVMIESRAAALKELKAPLAALYGALTPQQKLKADQLLTGMGCMM